jgi:hypothetical protein
VFASELIQQDRGQATVFIPVPGRVHPIGRVTPLVIPAAELAIISHQGSLADADLSYATLGSYATTHEISIDGPPREYYLRGAAGAPGQRLVEASGHLAAAPAQFGGSARCGRWGGLGGERWPPSVG